MTDDQDWVVRHLARVQGVRHAIVVSVDGLLKAKSEGTGRDVADRLAAQCSGLFSLGRSQANEHGTGDKGLHQVMIRYEGGLLLVCGAAEGSFVAVVTGPVIDPALVGQEMQAMVQRLDEALATAARQLGSA